MLSGVKNGYSLGALLLADAADRHHAKVEWLSKSHFVAEAWDGKEVSVYSHRGWESPVSEVAQRDKLLMRTLLKEAGAPLPQGRTVADEEEAVTAWREIAGPVVLKPRFGTKGRGITVNVDNEAEVFRAYRTAHAQGAGVLLEEFLVGLEYRCIGTPDRCVSVLKRIPPHVQGDGHSTVETLIAEKNEIRKLSPHLANRPIRVTEFTEAHLAKQGLSLSSVPQAGMTVMLSQIGNFSQGAESFECTERAPAALKEAAKAALSALPGLTWGAVDLLVDSRDGLPRIIEVNTDGGLGGHTYPVYGPQQPVAEFNWQSQWKVAERMSGSPAPAEKLIFHSEPRRIIRGDRRLRLARLLRSHLLKQDFEIVRVSPQLHRITLLGQAHGWLAGVLTERDKESAVITARRVHLQHKLLQRSQLPVLPNVPLTDRREVQDLLEEHKHGTLLRKVGPWSPEVAEVIKSDASLDDEKIDPNQSSWVVQARPDGIRLRLLATSNCVYAALSREDSLTDQTESETALAAMLPLALKAVQSIPELRWACVDLVSTTNSEVYVEGLSLNCWISPAHRLLAGSMDDFFEAIRP